MRILYPIIAVLIYMCSCNQKHSRCEIESDVGLGFNPMSFPAIISNYLSPELFKGGNNTYDDFVPMKIVKKYIDPKIFKYDTLGDNSWFISRAIRRDHNRIFCIFQYLGPDAITGNYLFVYRNDCKLINYLYIEGGDNEVNQTESFIESENDVFISEITLNENSVKSGMDTVQGFVCLTHYKIDDDKIELITTKCDSNIHFFYSGFRLCRIPEDSDFILNQYK